MIEYLLISHYPAQGPAVRQRPFGGTGAKQTMPRRNARLITFILPHPGPRYKTENAEPVDILTSRLRRRALSSCAQPIFAARCSGRLQKTERCSGLPLPKYVARIAVRLHIWTAAPAPPRLFLPQAAARLRSQAHLAASAAGSTSVCLPPACGPAPVGLCAQTAPSVTELAGVIKLLLF